MDAMSVVWCDECKMKLCTENGCDEDMHRVTSRRTHERVPVTYEEKKAFSKIVVCYSCGQKYTPASLSIHLDSCPVQRKIAYRDIPKELRPPQPTAPDAPIPSDTDGRSAYTAYNKEAKAIYAQHMAACPHPGCGRKFEPGSILKHMNGCRFRPK